MNSLKLLRKSFFPHLNHCSFLIDRFIILFWVPLLNWRAKPFLSKAKDSIFPHLTSTMICKWYHILALGVKKVKPTRWSLWSLLLALIINRKSLALNGLKETSLLVLAYVTGPLYSRIPMSGQAKSVPELTWFQI